jgi:hypothetical protein
MATAEVPRRTPTEQQARPAESPKETDSRNWHRSDLTSG